MSEFVPVNYRLIKKVPIDIYVKVGKKIVPLKSLSTDEDYLNEFVLRNQSSSDMFFIKGSDLQLLIKTNSIKIKMIKSLEESVELIDTTACLLFESFKSDTFPEQSIKDGYSLIQGTVTGNSKNYLSEIVQSLSANSDVASHSFVRSIICYNMAQSLGWQREPNYQNLIIASVLADIGNILNPTEDHPKNSLAFLGPYEKNEDIKKIIAHHHENFDGSGPLKLTKDQIHPLSKMLRVADEIIHRNKGSLILGVEDILLEQKNLFDKAGAQSLYQYMKNKKVA